jgi:CBS domain-containing protein
MQLKEIMTCNVESITREAHVSEAARKMAAHDIGFLVVIDDKGPVGVITDRDITIRVVAEGLNPTEVPVGKAMTPEVEVVDETLDVEAAANLMKDKQIRRLLIRGENDRYVGVVSLGDLAVDTGNDQLSGATLEEISKPAQPR